MNLAQMQQMMNPHVQFIKKYLYDILRERYGRNEEIIDRIAPSLVTQKDLEDFGKLIMDVYEVAFFKAITEQGDLLKKAGVKFEIVADKKKQPVKSESLFKK